MHTYIRAIVMAGRKTHVRNRDLQQISNCVKCEQLSTVRRMVICSYILSVPTLIDSIVVAHTSHTISLNRTAKTNLS